MSIEIKNFKKSLEGKAIAEFTILLPKIGVLLRKCRVYQGEKGHWISLPSFSYDNNGEKKYVTYFQFHDINVQKEFLNRVKEAVVPFLEEQPEMIADDIF